MKKRHLIAALAAAFAVVNMSPMTVDAAKVKKEEIINVKWSTKTKYEWVQDDHELKGKTEVKALITAKPDPETFFGIQFKFKQSSNNTTLEEKNKITMEDVWIERKVNPALTARVGSMPLEIGTGYWMDGDGLAGLGARWTPNKNDTFHLFAGKDSQEDTEKELDGVVWDPTANDGDGGFELVYEQPETQLTQVIAWNHQYDKGDYGLHVGRIGDNKYKGGFITYEINDRLKLSTEYVVNSYSADDGNKLAKKGGVEGNPRGIVVELKYGTLKLKKQGDIQYVATYLNSDAGLFISDDYTAWDDNYDEKRGFKGVGATVNYKLSKVSVLQLEQFWGEFKNDGARWSNTGLKLTAKF